MRKKTSEFIQIGDHRRNLASKPPDKQEWNKVGEAAHPKIDDTVRHEQYGIGVVTSVSIGKVFVQFESKKIDVSPLVLEILPKKEPVKKSSARWRKK